MMVDEFNLAVEKLYNVFSKYQRSSTIKGCPCCVSTENKQTLHSKKLRELEDDDLSYYAFKAMTTFGNVEDFKHYLPRIFELAARRKLVVDDFVILGKLEYGDWKSWDLKEQEVLKEFILFWWKYCINESYFDDFLLIEINKIICDLPLLISQWVLSVESKGFLNFVVFIEFYFVEIIKGKGSFKVLSKFELKYLLDWIKNNSEKLEEGFYYYEDKDPEIATMISNTLYILEHSS